ncbi:hypothetical protein OGZ51_07135 [Lactococcus lactis]|uniref:Uncharacterized protein n=1 Tax=Lactococcus lactis TaxID=1358 RepID=A0A9X4S863_9LACT|nr:hypothetical protein [Lactococcus lactis]MDG4983914.1 hypothetical protein [Lactococcus lactis]
MPEKFQTLPFEPDYLTGEIIVTGETKDQELFSAPRESLGSHLVTTATNKDHRSFVIATKTGARMVKAKAGEPIQLANPQLGYIWEKNATGRDLDIPVIFADNIQKQG